jgi:hypothetical protein
MLRGSIQNLPAPVAEVRWIKDFSDISLPSAKRLFRHLWQSLNPPIETRIRSFRDIYLPQDDFRHLMRNLPVPVADDDIDQMFDYADTDKDGRLSYKEFQMSLL